MCMGFMCVFNQSIVCNNALQHIGCLPLSILEILVSMSRCKYRDVGPINAAYYLWNAVLSLKLVGYGAGFSHGGHLLKCCITSLIMPLQNKEINFFTVNLCTPN